ncbi:MAG: TldD/PmbA family protein [Defluviitaleaceae bacterium]|nr:TldD/PmbA family protein [Defluviitaleaceae bacterium]MCL2238438.1 TldD/PmbA family protein [Defluviitaleaceae bacterium]
MKEQLTAAMKLACALGADFADVRVKDIRSENLRMENGLVTNTARSRSMGYGVRVYAGGALGFAAGNVLEDMENVVRQAYDIAKASQTLLKNPAQLDEKKPAQGTYATEVKTDPFAVPMAEKLEILQQCEKAIRGVWETHSFATPMKFRTGMNLDFRSDGVIFADTDGSYIQQDFCQCTARIEATVISETDTQTRKYINVVRGGFEGIVAMDLPNRAHGLAQEAAAIIEAPDCPSGEFDVILTPRQMFLQIHESVGHPTELDRVLGSEAAFAGRSFLTTGDYPAAGSAREKDPLIYGSTHVTIVADAHCPGGLGTFAYDDEGVPAQCITLIDKGKFTGFQTSRDYAQAIGQNSGGAGISDGWRNLPIVRMTNINMLPGDKTLEELIAGIEYGFIFDENKSWSIDDLRNNFQFACEIAHEIKDGKRTGAVFKNPIYSGKTTEFWASCDGVGNPDTWELVGVPNCGKGQPMQMMRVSHGSSPTRFRKVKVGVQDVR